jgi:hypothetical protein
MLGFSIAGATVMKSVSTNTKQTAQVSKAGVNNDKALKLLASSIFKQLQEEGCEPRDIISVSSQLIDLVTIEITKDEPSQM